jgi:hypothetical protein
VILAPIGCLGEPGDRMKTAFWLGIGVLTLAWFIYLIVKEHRTNPTYLFWSFCVTPAVVILVAMGIDFVSSDLHEKPRSRRIL